MILNISVSNIIRMALVWVFLRLQINR